MSFTVWAFIFLLSIGLMVLAGEMARRRRRSVGAWLWITAFVGPLGPLALYLLGYHRSGAPQA
jgi:hypothetical protein